MFVFFLKNVQSQKHTLKPPILWSFLNSFPFLYQRREGTGLPIAWQRNFTVLLAGTAWSCFSIFSGITHWGANARNRCKHRDYNHFSLHDFFQYESQGTKRQHRREQKLAYGGAFRYLLIVRWIVYFPLRMTHHLLHLQRILLHRLQHKSDVWRLLSSVKIFLLWL